MNKLLKTIIFCVLYIIIFWLLIKMFFELWDETDFLNRDLYKNFLENFLSVNSFYDRYWYGLHYLQSILLTPFLIFKYSIWELVFKSSWFIFVWEDPNLNNVILYSWKIVSVLSFSMLIYFAYKIVHFFTKDSVVALFPWVLLWLNLMVFDYSSMFRVDIPLTAFCIWSLYFAIKYLDKYKLKYLLLFIFFSLFAFIIKYQALMYIASIYLLIFIFIIINKKYKHILYSGGFFILTFFILHFNYNQLLFNIKNRFNPESEFMALNPDELINKTYWLVDRLHVIKFSFIINYWITIFTIVMLWFFWFIIFMFLWKIKLRYSLIIMIPLLVNYYAHLFLVYILNWRHYLIMYSIITITSIIWMYFIYSLIPDKKGKFNLTYIKKWLILIFIWVIISGFSWKFSLVNRYHDKNKETLQEVYDTIAKTETVLFLQDKSVVPFWLNYIYEGTLHKTVFDTQKEEVDKMISDNKWIIIKEDLLDLYKEGNLIKFEQVKEFYYFDDLYFIYKKIDDKEVN